MTRVKFYAVYELPALIENDAVYFVRGTNADTLDIWVASNTGVAVLVWNGPRIKAQIDAALAMFNIPITWNLVEGRPQSMPTDIDAAVAAAHTHANAAVLAELADAAGELLYRGTPVKPDPIVGLDGGHF